MSPHAHYDGTSKYKVWEAVRASTCAPGYFEEFLLDGNVFQVKEKFIYLDKEKNVLF
jgi:predicted acylesterase/phospholipase RssA